MLALALVALGQFGGSAQASGDLELPRHPLVQVPEPERFVRRPLARTFWSEGATKRFVGALAGGAVGAALPVALALAAQPRCAALCPATPVAVAVGTMLAPVLAVAGASAMFALLGGTLSPGVAVAGSLGGLALGALFLFASAAVSPLVLAPATPTWPAAVVASGLVLSAMALALEARHEALEEAPFLQVSPGRFAATTLTMAATLGLGSLLSLGLGALAFSAPLGLGVGTVSLALAPLVPLAVHRALGGRAGAGWAYLGLVASLGVAGAAFLGGFIGGLAGGFGPRRDVRLDAAVVFSASAGALGLVFGVPLFLEFGHGLELLERSEEAGRPRLSVAPVPGGAVGGLALSF
jgi:hypothetical protein